MPCAGRSAATKRTATPLWDWCSDPLSDEQIAAVNKIYDNTLKYVLGLSTQKVFREPQITVNKKELSTHKILQDREFAFVPTTDTWKVFAFGLNKGNGTIVVSPIYEFFSTDETPISHDGR